MSDLFTQFLSAELSRRREHRRYGAAQLFDLRPPASTDTHRRSSGPTAFTEVSLYLYKIAHNVARKPRAGLIPKLNLTISGRGEAKILSSYYELAGLEIGYWPAVF